MKGQCHSQQHSQQRDCEQESQKEQAEGLVNCLLLLCPTRLQPDGPGRIIRTHLWLHALFLSSSGPRIAGTRSGQTICVQASSSRRPGPPGASFSWMGNCVA